MGLAGNDSKEAAQSEALATSSHPAVDINHDCKLVRNLLKVKILGVQDMSHKMLTPMGSTIILMGLAKR